MIRLPFYVFFIGGFFSYAAIFFESPAASITMSVIGMTLSLYIWYIISYNRDTHLKRMLEKRFITYDEVREQKISLNSRLWVILYSVSFIAMNVSGLLVIKALLDNIDIAAQPPVMEELVATLGTEYVLFSWIFFISGILSLFLYGKLITMLYNDENKIQTFEGKRRNMPIIVFKPLSILLMILFTLVTYGLFSWFMRYRLASLQRIHNYMEKNIEKTESVKDKEEEKRVEKPEEIAKTLLLKHSDILSSTPEDPQRKEAIASLFKDLGELKTEQARSLLSTLLSKELLTENEFRKLTRLLV